MKISLITNLMFLSLLVGCGTTNSTGENNNTTATPNTAENGEEKESETAETAEGKTLIAYFSATSNTKRIAEYIQEETGGTLFEITPKDPYTSADLNYNNTESRVYKEHSDESLQDIELVVTTPEEFASYDNVFIGYPIWWGNAAWPINNFVKDNNFTGKKIFPFATSASSSLGNSVQNLKNLNNTGDWNDGRRFASSASKSAVVEWVSSLSL